MQTYHNDPPTPPPVIVKVLCVPALSPPPHLVSLRATHVPREGGGLNSFLHELPGQFPMYQSFVGSAYRGPQHLSDANQAHSGCSRGCSGEYLAFQSFGEYGEDALNTHVPAFFARGSVWHGNVYIAKFGGGRGAGCAGFEDMPEQILELFAAGGVREPESTRTQPPGQDAADSVLPYLAPLYRADEGADKVKRVRRRRRE